jgi:hypothetical protein
VRNRFALRTLEFFGLSVENSAGGDTLFTFGTFSLRRKTLARTFLARSRTRFKFFW